MGLSEILAIVSCVSSIITMVIVILAVLPHVKNGMAVIRDAVLWIAFVVVLGLAAWLGWQRLIARRPTPSASQPAWASQPAPAAQREAAPFPTGADPFYAYRER